MDIDDVESPPPPSSSSSSSLPPLPSPPPALISPLPSSPPASISPSSPPPPPSSSSSSSLPPLPSPPPALISPLPSPPPALLSPLPSSPPASISPSSPPASISPSSPPASISPSSPPPSSSSSSLPPLPSPPPALISPLPSSPPASISPSSPPSSPSLLPESSPPSSPPRTPSLSDSMDLCTSSDRVYCDYCDRVETGFGAKFKAAIAEGITIAKRQVAKYSNTKSTIYNTEEIFFAYEGTLCLGNADKFHKFLCLMSTASVQKELSSRALGFPAPILDGLSDSIEYHSAIGRCDLESRLSDCFVEDFDICKLFEIHCREGGFVETAVDGNSTFHRFAMPLVPGRRRRGNDDTLSDVSSVGPVLEPTSSFGSSSGGGGGGGRDEEEMEDAA